MVLIPVQVASLKKRKSFRGKRSPISSLYISYDKKYFSLGWMNGYKDLKINKPIFISTQQFLVLHLFTIYIRQNQHHHDESTLSTKAKTENFTPTNSVA